MTAARDDRQAQWPAQALDQGLYVVATPIGNLRDVTFRALDVLAGADIVLAEDTRVTRILLDAHGVTARPRAYHEHNAAAVRPAIVDEIAAGRSVALVSDAGTPLVSDPGFKLVRDVAAAGLPVWPVPGASAALAGLVAAGLPVDQFTFAGFPPAKSGARRAFFEALKGAPGALILYETGPRLAASLADMAAVLGPREAVVARELTKRFEDHRRGDLHGLAAALAAEDPPRGEIVVVLGPAEAASVWDDAAVDAALAPLLADTSVKAAAADIAAVSGRPRREVYARAVALKSGGTGA